jgi:hypothetical protein
MWVRQSVRCEAHDVSANQLAQLHRFADQIGMTTAGLAEMGWKVAEDQVSRRAAETPDRQAQSSRDRLSVVNGGD